MSNILNPKNFVEEFNKIFPHTKFLEEVDEKKFIEIETINIGEDGGLGIYTLEERGLMEDEFFHLSSPKIVRDNYKCNVVNFWFEYMIYHNLINFIELDCDQPKKVFEKLVEIYLINESGTLEDCYRYTKVIEMSFNTRNNFEETQVKNKTLLFYDYFRNEIKLVSRELSLDDGLLEQSLWDLEVKIYKKRKINMFKNKKIRNISIELNKGFEFVSDELNIKVEKKDVTFTKISEGTSVVTTVSHEDAKKAINKLIVGKKISELSEAQQRLISLDNIITNIELSSDSSDQIENILG